MFFPIEPFWVKTPEQTRQLLGQLADMLPQDATEKDVLKRIFWLLGECIETDTLCILRHQESRYIPEQFRGAHSARLHAARAGIREPVVFRAYENGELRELESSSRNRFFLDESQAMACSIKGYGVVYLGRREEPGFTEQDKQSLVVLCQYAQLALQNAQLFALKVAPRVHEATLQLDVAQRMLRSFSAITEAMTELMKIEKADDLLPTAGAMLPKLAEIHAWAVVTERNSENPVFCHEGEDLNHQSLKGLAYACMESESAVPLHTLSLEKSSYGRPTPKAKACRVSPMFCGGQVIACFVLVTTRAHFSLQEQRIVDTFALNVGSYYTTLRYYEKLQESQAALVQASKMAAIGQLAAGVAHELNTPLGAIKLAVQGAILNLENKPDRALPRLERSLKSVDQLHEIVQRLLHYSGKTAPSGESQLNEVVENSLALVGHQLSIDGVEVNTDLTRPLPTIDANENELQQVLVNLLTNARDASLEGSQSKKEIFVSTHLTEKAQVLRVRDTGVGMDDELLKRVREPFFTTKEVGKGTGLGLSVSAEILQRYGAELVIDSEPGKGSSFSILFPLSSA